MWKDPYEAKYQYLIKKTWKNERSKGFYSIFKWYAGCYKNSEYYNPIRKCNALIVFDDMIADMISNRKT